MKKTLLTLLSLFPLATGATGSQASSEITPPLATPLLSDDVIVLTFDVKTTESARNRNSIPPQPIEAEAETESIEADPVSLGLCRVVKLPTSLEIIDLGPEMMELYVSFSNYNSCDWPGDIEVLHVHPGGRISYVIKLEHPKIPSGMTLSAFILMFKPDEPGTHTYVARAIQINGQASGSTDI